MHLLKNSNYDYYKYKDQLGNYQFTSLKDLISHFMVVYVGEDKIISKVNKVDVAFHAQRAMQELSFDTFKSCKSKEITIPATLQMILPRDYVNYTKISWVDSAGIKHLLYPTSKTSNPSFHPLQDDNGEFTLEAIGSFTNGSKTITLDGKYDIITGMIATIDYPGNGSNAAQNYAIDEVTTTNDITTIVVASNWGYSTQDRLIRFAFNNGKLIPKTKKAVTLDGVSASTSARSMTAASASDAAKVEIGMFVIDDYLERVTHADTAFPKVVDIQGSTIYLNDEFTNSITSGQVNFISYEEEDSETWKSYKSTTPSENNNDDYEDDTYWPLDGQRYGLDPQHAQANGSFYIDCVSGKIHFSSNISGKTVVLDYISDSLGTEEEMQVHKFAEEAMYKWIMHAVLSTKVNIPEYQVRRLKKEKFAAIRQAKLRLSNIKLEEITQILRGKSKQIKH